MKIWLISDTHTRHEELNVPNDIDLVIHCGDESTHGDPVLNDREARRFLVWYSRLDIPTRIFVPGNHSVAIEQRMIQAGEFPDIQFLIHDQVAWNGLSIFGSPFTPEFFNWAYMKPREELDGLWQTIPEGIDVLITHGPPKGTFDVTRDYATEEFIHVGSGSLRRHVEERIKPKIHAYGHLHDEEGIVNYGRKRRGETEFINCACCNLANELVHHGLVIDTQELKAKNGTQRFFAGDTFAVAGASTDREKYGNKIFRALVASGRQTFPLNPTAKEVEGYQAYAKIADLPKVPESLSIVTPPPVTRRLVGEAIAAGVKNLWMQPGAEDPPSSQAARDAGVNVIDDGSCVLVALALQR